MSSKYPINDYQRSTIYVTVGKNDTTANFNTANYAEDNLAINAAIAYASSNNYAGIYVRSGDYNIINPVFCINRSNLDLIFSTKARMICNDNQHAFERPNTGSKFIMRGCNNIYVEGGLWDETERQILPGEPTESMPFPWQYRFQAVRILLQCYNSKNITFNKVRWFCYNFGLIWWADKNLITENILIENCYGTGCGFNDVIGGGTNFSVGFGNSGVWRNVTTRNTTIIQNGTNRQPFEPSHTPIYWGAWATNICNGAIVDNCNLYGNSGMAFDEFPHFRSGFINNRVYRAPGQPGYVGLSISQQQDLSDTGLEGEGLFLRNNFCFDDVSELRCSAGSGFARAFNISIDGNYGFRRANIFQANYLELKDNYFKGDGVETAGITIASSNNIKIVNNKINNFLRGINTQTCNNLTIENNQIYNCTNFGVYCELATRQYLIQNNRITGGATGIYLVGGNDNSTIQNNYLRDQTSNGILIDCGTNVFILANTINSVNNLSAGIAIENRNNLLGRLVNAQVVSSGTGYPPSVTNIINDGLGSDGGLNIFATNGKIASAVVSAIGLGYTTPTVTLTSPTGSGGSVTVSVFNTVTDNIVIQNNFVNATLASAGIRILPTSVNNVFILENRNIAVAKILVDAGATLITQRNNI